MVNFKRTLTANQELMCQALMLNDDEQAMLGCYMNYYGLSFNDAIHAIEIEREFSAVA